MKGLPIASAFIVSLIFVATAIFFATSSSFTSPVVSEARHQNSVAAYHEKFI